MLQLDHFAMFSQNFYESTFRLSQETGLGNYDGGFFPNFGIGIKVVPLGPDLFLEIEGVIDFAVIKRELDNPASRLLGLLSKREAFSAYCFRTDTLEELEELAKVAGFEVGYDVLNEDNAQQMMNGEKNITIMAPLAGQAWPRGMPNVYYWPDMSKHDARYPVLEGTGRVTPLGLSWVEVGGTAADFEAWFGGYTKAKDHPLRFNGKTHGLYAIAVNTDQGEVVIRRPSTTE